MLSVLIPTLNEIRHIRECIASVAWADEIVVVDSGSADGTIEAAEQAGARVVQFRWNKQFPKKKNWALENVPWKNDWVLILDADERIMPELAKEIQAELQLQPPQADGYYLNRRFMFLGQWIRHCGYYPSWNLRLFRYKLGRYEKILVGDAGSGDNEVHEHVILQGRSARLQNDMLHYAYPDIQTWIEKHNRYSSWEAALEVHGSDQSGQGIGGELSSRRRLRLWSRKLPFRPALRFCYSYFLKLGFLDGSAGFTFCRLLALYERMIVWKIKELKDRENQKVEIRK